MSETTPYDDILPRAGLPDSYWWLLSDDRLYLRRQWACIGIVSPDGTWRLSAWPPFKQRQAAGLDDVEALINSGNFATEASWTAFPIVLMARVVALCGEDGGHMKWERRRRLGLMRPR